MTASDYFKLVLVLCCQLYYSTTCQAAEPQKTINPPAVRITEEFPAPYATVSYPSNVEEQKVLKDFVRGKTDSLVGVDYSPKFR